MTRRSTGAALLLAAVIAAASLPGTPARADSIAEVEGARAHERAGHGLTRQEREKLRRYGGNDDGYYGGFAYDAGPSFGVIIAPGYGPDYGYGAPFDDEDDYED
jgi:hypothetical protein